MNLIKEIKRIAEIKKLNIDFNLSHEDIISEFKEKVDWSRISQHQKLSESFIREFKDEIEWSLISYYQTLSEDFIREFKDAVGV